MKPLTKVSGVRKNIGDDGASENSMQAVSIVLVLLYLVTLLAVLTKNWTIPYPTVMVLTGLAVSLVPNLPTVQLTPELVFLIFLPPLLYGAAWNISWSEFKKNAYPISMLAIGMVLVTTVAVAYIIKLLMPDWPWAAAFALGAIVSPPDAVAATSVTKMLPIPRRIIVILEGESLINDATGLVAYRLAVAAAAASAAGEFTVVDTLLTFFESALGGVLIGFIGGWIAVTIHRQLDDPVIETTLTLLTPYAVYMPCEAMHVSGVLAVVTCGLFVSQRSDWLMSSSTRLHARAVWENVLFVLNGLTFIFIGLGLRDVTAGLGEGMWSFNAGVALAVLLATIVLRILFVFFAAYLPRWTWQRSRKDVSSPHWAHVWVVAWTGMRGVVSLAAALALPLEFPRRELILFIAFAVILGTLVVQSLTLPMFIRRLKIGKSGRSKLEQELDARLAILATANTYLESHASNSEQGHRDLQYLRAHIELQADRIVTKLRLELDDVPLDENVWTQAACANSSTSIRWKPNVNACANWPNKNCWTTNSPISCTTKSTSKKAACIPRLPFMIN